MVRRYITNFVKDSLESFPAVLINGARQVGKSTLAQQFIKEGELETYISFDDLSQIEAARRDPHGFINRHTQPIIIDEIQRIPELLLAIKKSIDENRQPGRFLLTGSANIFSYPGISESLAGRMDVIHLEGLSLGETLQCPHPSSFIDDLFSGRNLKELQYKWQQENQNKPKLSTNMIDEHIFYGGFPEVILKKSLRFRERWFSSYQAAYIERDVRNINQLLNSVNFSKFFRLIGLQTANLVNQKSLAVEVNLDQRTVARYLEILEMTFQISPLTPWFSNTRKRLIKTSKLYLNDSGHACYLYGISDVSSLLRHAYYGALFETWMWSELRKLLALTTGIEQSFYRTHLGKEVDFLLYKGNTFWGIECKAAESVTWKDFQGLNDLKEALGERTFNGIVLYRGQQIITFSETLVAVPLTCLI